MFRSLFLLRTLLLFLIANLDLPLQSLGQTRSEIEMPSKADFEATPGDATRDTVYSDVVSEKSKVIRKLVWRIKKRDTLFEYYFDSNLKCWNVISKCGSSSVRYTDGTVRTEVQFEFAGACKIFYDDPDHKVAAVGQYKHNEKEGDWYFYSKDGKLMEKDYSTSIYRKVDLYDSNLQLRERFDQVASFKHLVTVKDVIYNNGREQILFDKPFLLKIYYRFDIEWNGLLALIFVIRVFINSRIYNREYGTNFSPIYFYFPGYVSKNYQHSLICTFSFWFRNYKVENRKLAIISNSLSITTLVLFFVPIILLLISGDIH